MPVDASHLPGIFGTFVSQVSADYSLPVDQLLLVAMLLLSIFFGPVFKRISNVLVKHVVSTVLGIGFGYLVVGMGVMHPLLNSVFVYLLVSLFPTSPALIWMFSMSYLSGGHIYRQIYDYRGWSMDFTLLQMISTIKQVMFAYNVADGAKLKKDPKIILHSDQKIHEYYVSCALTEIPNFFEYISYMFFYPSLLVGPAFDFTQFINYMNGSMFKKAGLLKIPTSFLESMKRLLVAVGCYLVFTLSSKFSLLDGYVVSDDFLYNTTFLYRMAHICIGMTLIRFRYFFAWYMSESACVSCGVSFNGVKNGVILWDRMNNVSIPEVELGTTVPILVNAWNKGTNTWLKYYVYTRVKPPSFLRFLGEKTYANVATKMTSAFWHGFYGGYYIFFFWIAMVNFVDDAVRRVFRPYVYSEGRDDNGKFFSKPIADSFVVRIFDFLCWGFTHLCFNYLGVAFALLDSYESHLVFKSTYYCVHIFCILSLVLFQVTATKKSKKPKTEQGGPKEVTKDEKSQ